MYKKKNDKWTEKFEIVSFEKWKMKIQLNEILHSNAVNWAFYMLLQLIPKCNHEYYNTIIITVLTPTKMIFSRSLNGNRTEQKEKFL